MFFNFFFFGKLWSLQTKKSSFVENSYECITVFENKTCLSIVFFFKLRYRWNGRMVFRCYFCALESGTLQEIIDHCSENHAEEPLKYREHVLDDKNGKFRFQAKYHQGIIPSILSKEGKEIFVKDNKTYIFDKKNKRKRLNTPLKEYDSRRRLFCR